MNRKAKRNYFRTKLEESRAKDFWHRLGKVIPTKKNRKETDSGGR